MIELYFLFYQIPKMMSRMAKERNRSAFLWSLAGIGAWIGSEFVVAFGMGIFYGLGRAFLGWPAEFPAWFSLLMYVLALAAAIGGFTVARRILSSKTYKGLHPMPPPPPSF